jgi:hypothetical protein
MACCYANALAVVANFLSWNWIFRFRLALRHVLRVSSYLYSRLLLLKLNTPKRCVVDCGRAGVTTLGKDKSKPDIRDPPLHRIFNKRYGFLIWRILRFRCGRKRVTTSFRGVQHTKTWKCHPRSHLHTLIILNNVCPEYAYGFNVSALGQVLHFILCSAAFTSFSFDVYLMVAVWYGWMKRHEKRTKTIPTTFLSR